MSTGCFRSAVGAATTLGACLLSAAAAAQSVDDLRNLSIDQLAEIEVTSASKRPEPVSAAPAAIYVITGDDVVRSGAPSLAEALRLAPNLQVQRVDARQYAVSARGFAGYETSNKLLVLVDGRSIYSTLFSGVLWDLRQIPTEDLDRIEVISGPGGSLWGANAVNGVINVTSKSALDTMGARVAAAAGPLERNGYARFGGALGEAGAYRVYAGGYDRSGMPAGNGGPFEDGGRGLRGGFRTDWSAGAGNITVQGDLFRQRGDSGSRDKGHNLLARWTTPVGQAGGLQVQAYYDRFSRDFSGVFDALATYDLAVQHDWTTGRHKIVWGGGIRATRDRFVNGANAFGLDPISRTLWIGNIFAQDSIALTPTLTVTAGAKAEQQSYTGLQILPSVRLAWQPVEGTLLWSAVSRAIRAPSRIDRELVFPGVLEAGGFRSEKLTAIEAGYRGQPTADTSLSVSVFYNLYDDLRTTSTDPVTGFLPVRLANDLRGHEYGVEAWATAALTPWWRLSAGLSTLHKDFRLRPGATDLENGISLGNDPDFQLLLRSRFDVTRDIDLDVALRGVDSLPDPRVPTYVEANARIAWRARPGVELFAAGENLLHDRHDESADTDRGQLIRRSVVAGVRLDF
ncbi:MAG TPA: TonB-dependent receptor [Sphingomonas sp.]|jgi:iron complex outermembrane receptor protein|uniref:TonB-dependent receptor plug domain-containing protein n=1 Tax=Sphingomonas sp. TaxID=28214 RepID=UPI002ED80D44